MFSTLYQVLREKKEGNKGGNQPFFERFYVPGPFSYVISFNLPTTSEVSIMFSLLKRLREVL